MTGTVSESILDLPLAARQRIVVVTDSLAEQVVEELRRAPEPAEDEDEEDRSLLDRARGVLRRKVDDQVATLASAAVALRHRALDLRIVSDSQTKELRFPPGHPSRGVLYIAHPVVRDQYYPAANFHRLLVEHKFAEAMDLLMELGAKSISIEQVRGYKEEDLLSIVSAIPVLRIKGKSQKTSESQSTISLDAELEGSPHPTLPTDLSWYEHEPMWVKLAENRMDGHLRKFVLAVRHLDSMCVDRSLEVEVKKFGIRSAANSKSTKTSSGDYPVSFPRWPSQATIVRL